VVTHLGCQVNVDRPSQNWSWGSKLPQEQNLEDDFVVFFVWVKTTTLKKLGG